MSKLCYARFVENAYCLYRKCNNGDDALEDHPAGLGQVSNFFVFLP
jgi:hypothetical protein